MPRNVRGCANLGLCNIGCPSGAKQSALVTWMPRAERAGARVAGAGARRAHPRPRRARRAASTRRASTRRRGAPQGELVVEAPRVCLAGGVLGTPALLLRSGLGPRRRGRRGLQFHSSVHVTARFAEPVHGYYGPTMAYAVTEFSDVNGHAGPGFMIENVTVDPVTTAASLPGFGAAARARAWRRSPTSRARSSCCATRRAARSTLDGDGARDASATEPLPADLARLRDGMAAIARAYLAAGAIEVFLPLHGSAPVRRESDLAALARAATSRRARALAALRRPPLRRRRRWRAIAARGVCDPRRPRLRRARPLRERRVGAARATPA